MYDKSITVLAITQYNFISVGFLVDFIPVPVISGFTSAAAITIAVGQLKVRMYILSLVVYSSHRGS